MTAILITPAPIVGFYAWLIRNVIQAGCLPKNGCNMQQLARLQQLWRQSWMTAIVTR